MVYIIPDFADVTGIVIHSGGSLFMRNNEMYEKLFNEGIDQFKGKKRLNLFRTIENFAKNQFKNNDIFSDDRNSFGKEEAVDKILRVALDSDWKGIKEYTDEFYKYYEIASRYQHFVEELVCIALEKLDHGFSDFDKTLIIYSARISEAYDKYYVAWLKAVRNSEAAKEIERRLIDQEGSLKNEIETKKLDSRYTIIDFDYSNDLCDIPYGVYFKDELVPILGLFDQMCDRLESVPGITEQQERVIVYLRQYRKCLSLKDKSLLEPEWKKLDEIWMDVKYPLQVIHDIEYDYGDPLRVKVIPAYTIRFLDDKYIEENQKIKEIQKMLVDYFKKRKTDITQKSIKAFENSWAAMYYVPFQSSSRIQFRSAGQSIPNRTEVKFKKGTKIYFDPVTMDQRKKQVYDAMEKVVDSSLIDRYKKKVDSLMFMIYLVSGHELGHSIYHTELLKGVVDSQMISLSEETRADLCGYSVMNMYLRSGRSKEKEIQRALFSAVAFDMRRFVFWDSEVMLPYRNSAVNVYKTCEKTGYLNIINDRLVVDESKTEKVLECLQNQFERILGYIDAKDREGFESEYAQITEESEIIAWMRKKLFKSSK
ncbi:hypothetical protein JW710_00440 [Candidatus Dojkabacteria bacterium]|nr:hypothetical protein [Candidatus Dojkabacteria bacterium]